MKNCKKCGQSFFDEVDSCACGSTKFINTRQEILEEKITKKIGKPVEDIDWQAEKEYEQKEDLLDPNGLLTPSQYKQEKLKRILARQQPLGILNKQARNQFIPKPNTALPLTSTFVRGSLYANPNPQSFKGLTKITNPLQTKPNTTPIFQSGQSNKTLGKGYDMQRIQRLQAQKQRKDVYDDE